MPRQRTSAAASPDAEKFRFRLSLRGVWLWITVFAAFCAILVQSPPASPFAWSGVAVQVLSTLLLGGIARAFSGSFGFACLGAAIGFLVVDVIAMSNRDVAFFYWPFNAVPGAVSASFAAKRRAVAGVVFGMLWTVLVAALPLGCLAITILRTDHSANPTFSEGLVAFAILAILGHLCAGLVLTASTVGLAGLATVAILDVRNRW